MTNNKQTRYHQSFFSTIIIITVFSSFCFADLKNIKDIPVPYGYERITYKEGTYAKWISDLKIKSDFKVLKYNGTYVKDDYYLVYAVVDMPLLFKQDLEQCADYSFRFWAEYHKETDALDRLYLFDYAGKKKYYKDSNKSFKSFLKHSMAYSNSHSIKMGSKKVDPDSLIPGDMVVQNETGGIGHVSVIMDVSKNNKNEKLYLIGYSFMPAQEFHIENADAAYGQDGWFSIDGYTKYLKKFLDLGKPVYRRFK